MIHATKWIDLQNIIATKRNQTQKTIILQDIIYLKWGWEQRLGVNGYYGFYCAGECVMTSTTQ